MQDVQVALRSAGYDWAGVETDGLQVRLTGTAPSEVDRFRAMTQAATAVDSSRILDQMTVAAAEALDPPDFKVELLRNPQGISLIGLVPASTDRNALLRSLRSETSAPKVTDLLETADYKLPEGWQAALDYGIQAAQMAGSAKISIQPGAVTVAAITDSRAEKGRLETALKRAVPKGVRLTSQITAPRPVIAPFTMRFVIDGDGPRFEACSAATEDGRQRTLEAALSAGLQGKPGCTLGLGAPSPDWDEAAEQAIAAVARLGQGTVTISDADVALTAPEAVTQVRFDEAAGRLEQALPRVFSLHAELERESGQDAGPAEFIAALSGDRALSMRGRIADVPMREAVDSFARARFSEVDSSLRSDAAVPDSWTVRVNGALEAFPGLFVAGNACSYYDAAIGRRRVDAYDHAVNSGILAGTNMARKDGKQASSTKRCRWTLPRSCRSARRATSRRGYRSRFWMTAANPGFASTARGCSIERRRTIKRCD
ncbi:MAG: hypothetical protein ABGW82_08540, partial [Paracoccus sp. (in: a-proteobacteria)]